MENLKALIKLDYRLVSPYWKWLLLFAGIALLISVQTVEGVFRMNGYSFVIAFIVFFATCTAFPFESTDKYNMNVLYSTLPSNRKSQVTARYLSILIFLGLSLVVAIVGGIIMNAIFLDGNNWQFMGTVISVSIAIYIVMAGFQTPFMYKFGYQKGRIAIWVGAIIIVAAQLIPGLLNTFGVENYSDFDLFALILNPNNALVTSIVSLLIGVVGLVASYFISLRVHLKRDF